VNRLLPLLLIAPLLAGCAVSKTSRRDTTQLEGDVPTGLGRALYVQLVKAMPREREALMATLEREFVRGDLFDAVAEVGEGDDLVPSARLRLVVEDLEDRSEFDTIYFVDVYWVRLRLGVELKDADGKVVLSGHVDGIGVDDVSEDEFVDGPKRADVRLAAVHDAVQKISHGLRRAAFNRQTAALKALPEIGLPAGMAPLSVAVLGFDDAPNAFRLRGARMADLLTDTLIRLGSDFDVTAHDRAQRAVRREPPKGGFFEIKDYAITQIGQHLTARVFVVGQVLLEGGRVTARAKLITRGGIQVASAEASADGVGAMAVVAVDLAHKLGVALQEVDLPGQ
jgi:hypothetical protein